MHAYLVPIATILVFAMGCSSPQKPAVGSSDVVEHELFHVSGREPASGGTLNFVTPPQKVFDEIRKYTTMKRYGG